MTIHPLFQGRAFDQQMIDLMVVAFDGALRELKLADRQDPMVEQVARVIVECAERGLRDAAALRDCALKTIRNPEL